MSASAPVPTTKVAKEKATTKDTPKKKKKKKKSKKKNASEKVPLMGKVKQAKMAHKMTKGLTWRQRWKLFKCYRKLSKLCSCCTST